MSRLDVYVPCKPKVKGEELKPVVIFVHGGVWASGDKWQFSPLGNFLAEVGVIAVLVQYTLYPEALAIEQVGEVSESLTWTMDNIAQYGGDPNRVFLMGHSSGAHLCAMVLWERANRRIEKTLNPKLSPHLDVRIPRGFLGLAGVYNIGEHFKYEVGRGVGAISCMRPANGWEPQFDAMSPSLLFESLLLHKGVKFLHTDGKTGGKTDGGTDREADSSISTALSFKGLDLVPRCLLIASIRDITVPPTSSVAFNAMLQTLGCETRVVMHDEMAHEDFALWHRGWGSLKTHVGPFIEEVLRFVSTVEES